MNILKATDPFRLFRKDSSKTEWHYRAIHKNGKRIDFQIKKASPLFEEFLGKQFATISADIEAARHARKIFGVTQ